jgi:2-polyprenyl-3-methyl-5-hydroxy-6-metoxy-1,4-benzoquinol methylase
MPYKPHNVRDTCVCGDVRDDIINRIWQVHDDLENPAHHIYYYRCPTCCSFSAVNIYFPVEAYLGIPIEAFSIPELKHELNAARVNRILSCVALPEDAVFYDLGSGEGCFSDHFTRKVPRGRAIAIESDGRMRQRFYTNYQRVDFVEVLIEDFLKDTGGYPLPDLVGITDVLEHVVEPESVLGLIAHTLKPGGFVYLSVPNSRTYGTYPYPLAPSDVDWDRANQARQHLWMLEPKILAQLVTLHFEIIEMSRTFETKIRQDSDYTMIFAQKA